MKIRSAALFLFLVLAPLAQAQSGDLGSTEFPNSGAPAAQAPFMRGLLLLHSFEYDDAREAFRQAQEADPAFALAFWGVAMTHHHAVWHEQDTDAARAALQRLASSAEGRIAAAPTAREKDYMRAAEALFFGEGDKKARDLAWLEAMRIMHQRYPDDQDAAVLYALALLGSTDERDVATYMRAAAVAEEVFARNPRHPGAAHFLIHSYDDPIHAPLGLRAARAYSKIAPAASHALHMPSHIFVALGMWDDVVASNEASWESADARVQRKRLPVDDRNFHSLYWLEYAYLQQGRYRDAARLLDIMERDAKKSGSGRTRYHLGLMRAVYAVETRQPLARDASFSSTKGSIIAGAAHQYAVAVSALNARDLNAARAALADIQALIPSGPSAASTGHRHGGMSAASNLEQQSVAIMEKQLRGLILLREGMKDTGLESLREAARAEDRMSFDYGPPVPPKPAHELLAEVLLEHKDAKARHHFELALKRAPRRALSLLGLARAAAQQGDAAAAAQAYGELRQVWQKADAGLPELAEIAPASQRAATPSSR